jgi:uncharacterized membrane protein YedE/YeeE
MNRLFAAIAAGLLFGIGLVASDMVNPARVLAFLDVAGDWDYSLALVMGGALIPSAIAYRIRARMQRPVCDVRFQVPSRRGIDARLLSGAALFGVGWGLVGLCPGPALASLTTGTTEAMIFVGAMLAGMVLYRWTLDRPAAASAPRH